MNSYKCYYREGKQLRCVAVGQVRDSDDAIDAVKEAYGQSLVVLCVVK